MSGLVEGNHNYGNPFSGDDLPPPEFCPVCGSPRLVPYHWDTVDRDRRYPSLVCYGRRPRWLVRLFRDLYPTSPFGAHYQYLMPSRANAKPPTFFDRMTGAPRP